ncbi:hypothetical protein Ae201684P_006893 [Aphanomyces euteiches]|uniref:RapZ C-terminal domain-containing protein n=1 Tax=Aphanomyces euteiches TaxID=100861 RepID=A0A6G0X8G1_9STRA|nr:hypothetical protein Ae201684_007385 [Aphanomyces euteiches]KAH9100699.1 hypothetical protein Ae201684P_006893 [Aphanomyces euteiches]KAH9135441.1 hypothetical protein AeRB84_019159 [Aphanomyces euteiches]
MGNKISEQGKDIHFFLAENCSADDSPGDAKIEAASSMSPGWRQTASTTVTLSLRVFVSLVTLKTMRDVEADVDLDALSDASASLRSLTVVSFGNRYWTSPARAKRGQTGQHKQLRAEVCRHDAAQDLIQIGLEAVRTWLGRSHVDSHAETFTLGVKCEMGRHRSVTIAEKVTANLRKECRQQNVDLRVVHRDIAKSGAGQRQRQRRHDTRHDDAL